ncbi:hypothetical protein BDZ94DRAFT_1242373 [Collybia nuda]|uniref:Uncharacterized protein n=1 Tax=Collybia nuda TaxID=64659 RepID=A0A9P5XTQ8_9AGAR|nr:hypothetical protein BDZ94DRAFT_1242373 [Collybia nuda]
MSSSFGNTAATAFRRALSPSTFASLHLSNVDPTLSQEADVREEQLSQNAAAQAAARTMLIFGADTLEQLLTVIPGEYQQCLIEPLKDVRATAQRLVSVRDTVQKWRHHKAAGTFPTQFVGKPVEIQFSKDFVESAEADAAKKKLLDAHRKYVQEVFDDALSAKEIELTTLEKSLEPKDLFDRLKLPVMELWPSIHRKRLRPRIRKGEELGEIIVDGVEEDPSAETSYMGLMNDLSTIGLRVVMLVEASHFAVTRKKDAKKNLKDAMDVDEGDESLRKKDLANAVKLAVDAAMKKKAFQPPPKNLKFKKGAAKGKPSSPPARKGKSSAGKQKEPQPRQAAKLQAMKKNGRGLKGKKSSQASATSGGPKKGKGKGRA